MLFRYICYIFLRTSDVVYDWHHDTVQLCCIQVLLESVKSSRVL